MDKGAELYLETVLTSKLAELNAGGNEKNILFSVKAHIQNKVVDPSELIVYFQSKGLNELADLVRKVM